MARRSVVAKNVLIYRRSGPGRLISCDPFLYLPHYPLLSLQACSCCVTYVYAFLRVPFVINSKYRSNIGLGHEEEMSEPLPKWDDLRLQEQTRSPRGMN